MNGSFDLYIVSTPYHMLISCSKCHAGDILVKFGMNEQSEFLRTMTYDFYGNNWVQGMSLADYKNNKAKFLAFKRNMRQMSEKLRLISESLRNIIIFSDLNPETQWLINNLSYTGKVILIEEGIGLYRPVLKQHDFWFRVFGKFFFGRQFENINQIGEFSKVDLIVCRFPDELNQNQKNKEIEKITNIEICKLREKYRIKGVECLNWFIGQPVVEDGVMSKEEYLGLILKLAEIRGGLVVKPHPRENIEKFSSNPEIEMITTNDIPIELLLDNKKEYNFFTLYSSAIVGVANYGKAFAMFRLAGINLPLNIESIFKQSFVKIPSAWDEVKTI